MERLDLLTSAGVPTGQTKPKAAVHRDGDWHLAVHIWIQRPDGALLMQRRSPQKENDPDRWDISVAGHVAAGESAEEAARREVAEEIGLSIHTHQLEPLFRLAESRHLNGGTYLDYEWHQVYRVAAAPRLAALHLQTEEVAALRWVPWPDFVAAVARRPADWVPHWAEYARLIERLAPLA